MRNSKRLKSTFIPGSEWLYIKIYCGVSVSNEILISKIKPITEKLTAENKITHWFFVRYADPENHLRVRFHLTYDKYFYDVVSLINKSLKVEVENKIVWKTTIDTYIRELNRYGHKTIEEIELFFYYDSIHFLELLESLKNEKYIFIELFKWIEFIVSQFEINDDELIIFLNSNQQKFKEEFHVNKRIKKELGFKYNDIIKNKIDKHHTTFLRKDYISNVIKSLKEINSNNEKKENLHRILSGLIHMSVNRLFSNNQRLYEMVIYDFLYKKSKTNFIRYGKI